MIVLVLRAYVLLLLFEALMVRRNFATLYRCVSGHPVRLPQSARNCEQVCRAVNVACVLYFKEVQCLQRSAALVSLLRDFGIPAMLVIGAQRLPFRAHAWAEVSGRVVNDSESSVRLYGVLDRL